MKPEIRLFVLLFTFVSVVAASTASVRFFAPIKLTQVRGLALDRDGNGAVRQISPDGVVTTIAGVLPPR